MTSTIPKRQVSLQERWTCLSIFGGHCLKGRWAELKIFVNYDYLSLSHRSMMIHVSIFGHFHIAWLYQCSVMFHDHFLDSLSVDPTFPVNHRLMVGLTSICSKVSPTIDDWWFPKYYFPNYSQNIIPKILFPHNSHVFFCTIFWLVVYDNHWWVNPIDDRWWWIPMIHFLIQWSLENDLYLIFRGHYWKKLLKLLDVIDPVA